MELIRGGNEPATKDDLRNLQLTMLAGFQLCLEDINVLKSYLHAMNPSFPIKEVDQAIMEQQQQFNSQLETACQQILERESME